MPKRTTEQVRAEIAAEREALVGEIHGLRQDAASCSSFRHRHRARGRGADEEQDSQERPQGALVASLALRDLR